MTRLWQIRFNFLVKYQSFDLYAWVRALSHFSHAQLFVTLWTVAWQAPLFMAFSGQEYWSPPPGDLPNPVIEPTLAGGFFTTSITWEVLKF